MFPHMRALDDPAELSEERRLAYVGITRARQRLYVSRAIVRSSWGQPMLNPESRFLREIPQELIEWRRTAPTPSFSAPVTGAGRFGTPRSAPTRSGGGQASAAGAGSRRPGDPRQVRAGSGRGSLGRRRIGDVADRLRQRRPGEADAQPRPAQQAVTLLASPRRACSDGVNLGEIVAVRTRSAQKRARVRRPASVWSAGASPAPHWRSAAPEGCARSTRHVLVAR